MTFRITISTRTALVLLVLAVLAFPATAYATHVFADVSDSNVHAEGIQFMKNSGVSIGCQDGTVYCPDDFVTRAQMATFMFRLDKYEHVLSAKVTAAGAKAGTGPYTTSKFATGWYTVSFDVESYGFPDGTSFTAVASPTCAGYTASVEHGFGAVTIGGKYVTLIPNVKTYNAAGAPADCAFSLLFTFDDPDS